MTAALYSHVSTLLQQRLKREKSAGKRLRGPPVLLNALAMQTQRHFVVQVEDVVRSQHSKGTFCEDFWLDANPFTNLTHTTTNDFQPSQGNLPARKKPLWTKSTHTSHCKESGFAAALHHHTYDNCMGNGGQVFAERDMTQAARELIRVRTITLSLLHFQSSCQRQDICTMTDM